MSKALSAAPTFEALAARVTSIETNATLQGVLHVDDANFQLAIEAGNPTVRFDGVSGNGDGIVYVRASNIFLFYVGDVTVASLDSSGNMKLKGTLSQNAL